MINNLKVRASWGQLGNGAILGLYDYIPVINSSSSMGVANYYQSNMASVDKTWEIITSTNVGLDLGMLNNRLTFTGDYYWKKNDNMLAGVTLPHIVGISVPNSNVGTLKTWGWEIELGWRDRWKDLSYNFSFNLSDSDNKVVDYSGQNTIWAGSVGILEGYPLNTIWGYKTDGYWSSRQEYLDYKAAHPGYQSFNDAKVGGGDVRYVAQGNPDHQIGQGAALLKIPVTSCVSVHQTTAISTASISASSGRASTSPSCSRVSPSEKLPSTLLKSLLSTAPMTCPGQSTATIGQRITRMPTGPAFSAATPSTTTPLTDGFRMPPTSVSRT